MESYKKEKEELFYCTYMYVMVLFISVHAYLTMMKNEKYSLPPTPTLNLSTVEV